MPENRDTVLRDHKKQGKRLIPPFLAALGKTYSPYSWLYELTPELLWIALLVAGVGYERARILAEKIGSSAAAIWTESPKPLFATMSSFSCILEPSRLQGRLSEQELNDVREALRPMHFLISESPFRWVFEGCEHPASTNCDWQKVLGELYDRNSRLSALTISIAVGMGHSQEKIFIVDEDLARTQRKHFQNVVDYPNTEESLQAAGAFRASAPMFLLSAREGEEREQQLEWISAFWDSLSGFGECQPRCGITFIESEPGTDLEAFVVAYCNAAKAELADRIDLWPLDLKAVEVQEVLSCLLARQTSLAIQVAASPGTWNPDAAPIFLRAMADVFITTAWILEESEKRARIYIEDGLGAIKLQLAHKRKALAETSDPKEREQLAQICEHWENWLSSQKLEALVEVNLGSWSGISTRKMAEEAGFLDFYNHVYQPFSAAVHSTWSHVSDKNCTICANPAHRFHRVPAILDWNPDPEWMRLAAKYLEKTFRHFDSKLNIVSTVQSAYQSLCDGTLCDDWSPEESSSSDTELDGSAPAR